MLDRRRFIGATCFSAIGLFSLKTFVKEETSAVELWPVYLITENNGYIQYTRVRMHQLRVDDYFMMGDPPLCYQATERGELQSDGVGAITAGEIEKREIIRSLNVSYVQRKHNGR